MSDFPMSTERLAEIIWTARKRALGDHDDDKPFDQTSPRIRKQYAKEAEEVAKLLAQDRDAELEELRAQLAEARAAVETFRAPDDFHNAEHRARRLAALTEQITEMAGRPPADIAQAAMLAADAAIWGVEREQAHIVKQAETIAAGSEALRQRAEQAEAERDKARATATFLSEIMAGTVLLGANDAIGMVRALTQHLTDTGVIDPDQAQRVNAGLDKQQADHDGLTEQRDQARMAVDRAEKLAEQAADAGTTVAPRALAEAVADVAQLCPGCWRVHGLWCHPYGGPMADLTPAAQRDSARTPDAGT